MKTLNLLSLLLLIVLSCSRQPNRIIDNFLSQLGTMPTQAAARQSDGYRAIVIAGASERFTGLRSLPRAKLTAPFRFSI